jgi:hypothetical protein
MKEEECNTSKWQELVLRNYAHRELAYIPTWTAEY